MSNQLRCSLPVQEGQGRKTLTLLEKVDLFGYTILFENLSPVPPLYGNYKNIRSPLKVRLMVRSKSGQKKNHRLDGAKTL